MDFNKLLEPYEEGSFPGKPFKRSIGTITDYLVNKKQYPLEIAGGAIFLVFNYLNSGGEFKGNGKQGSKGRELVTSIRKKCDDLLRERLKCEMSRAFLQVYAKDLKYNMQPSTKRTAKEMWDGKTTISHSPL